jgi:hypothetical protein
MSDDRLAATKATMARILRPMVRLAIHAGLPLQGFVEILKTVYVDVAERHFSVGGRALSDAKASSLTGVHRKDVRRVREMGLGWVMPERGPLTKVAGAWGTLSNFVDDDGRRKRLLRGTAAKTGVHDGVSFDALVAQTLGSSADANQILADLVSHKMARLLADGSVEMDISNSLSNPSDADRMALIAMNGHDTIAAMVENLLSRERVHPGVSIFSLACDLPLVHQLHLRAEEEILPTLEKWNALVAQAEAQRVPGQPTARVNCDFRIYYEKLAD